jgi:hypothetical protein
MFYEDVFRALNKGKVRYAVAGGVAVVLHGYIRFTADLDLIIHLEEKNIDKFFNVLSKLGYKPKLPISKEQFTNKQNREDWIKHKGMVVFSFYQRENPLKNIDLFVKEPIQFKIIQKNIKMVKAENLSIPLLSLKHLIQIKKKVNRERDIIDITNLEKIHGLIKQ